MKNFEKFGIPRLSYSALTSFYFERAKWVIETFYDFKFPYSPPAIRGFALEKTVSAKYLGGDPLQVALDYYDQRIEKENENCEFSTMEQGDKRLLSCKKERTIIERVVPLLLKKLDLILPDAQLLIAQKKLVFKICDIDFIGYVDFQFETKTQPIILDLKSASKKSGLTTSVMFQQAIYNHATNITPAVLYCYPTMDVEKGKDYRVLSNLDMYYKQVEKMVKSMDRFLGMVKDKEELIELTHPNPDDWRWGVQETIARKEVFGI
tara:strand:- start:374 stop:1165 length:792 start_codon:yes stop_codon:yes gene_type:complete